MDKVTAEKEVAQDGHRAPVQRRKDGAAFVDERATTAQLAGQQALADGSARVAQLREVADVAAQGGRNQTGMPDALKAGIESLSGLDMSAVRVHRNSDKPAQLNAHAYAQGTEIHLAAGQEKHLPHEAWHVVQQMQGRVQPTMQMNGGMQFNDDVGLEGEADLMGERVRAHTTVRADQRSSKPFPGASDRALIQRIVRIGGANVMPQHHVAFIAQVRYLIEAEELFWTPAMEVTLTGWLTSRAIAVDAPSPSVLAYNLVNHGSAVGKWENMQQVAFAQERIEKATRRRNQERFARLMAPHSTQTTKRVPGLGKLPNRQLLRLAETGKKEQEFWMRPSPGKKGRLSTAKRKDITAVDEAHITASGLADDPSYTVQRGNHQLGHRYRGTDQIFIKGAKHARTYGSKNSREGYEYKGSGLVDGHSVQVQDDQPILGPYEGDAPDWATTISKTDGSSVTYKDSGFLPKDKNDERFMETMPHNFYWENQEQGKHMRQKTLETPAMKDQTSFLHYNHYTGNTFHPNAGSAMDHIYDIPSRIDYLTTDASGADAHYHVDNRPTADYSRPSEYDPVKHLYAEVPGGIPAHHLNKDLGGESATVHRDRAKMPDTKAFPFATVLEPGTADFSFKPDWRSELSGYETPPGTPYFDEEALEESMEVETGDLSHMQRFEHKGGVVDEVEYDESKDKTSLTINSIKTSKPESWKDSTPFPVLAAKTLPKGVPAPTSGVSASSTPAPKVPVATTGATPQSADYQRRWLQLSAAFGELFMAMAADNPARATLHVLELSLVALSAHDPAQLAQLNVVEQNLLAWFSTNHPTLQRRFVGGNLQESANDATAAFGQRLPSLRQFFNECGQMAVFNALAMAANAAPDSDAVASTLGNFEENITEDTIRALIAPHRQDVPVLGNLAQVWELATFLEQGNTGELDDRGITPVEQLGLAEITRFRTGDSNTLTVIVNTRSHRNDPGIHWIAVQLVRQGNGHINVQFRDSFDQPKNYSHLFAALRTYFGHIPH